MENHAVMGSLTGWWVLIQKIALWVLIAFAFGFLAGVFYSPAQIVQQVSECEISH